MTVFSRLAFAVLWLFVFSIPSEKAIELPGIGTVTKLIGFAAVGLGVLAVLIEQRIRVPAPFHKALAVFLLWSGLTLHWTIGLEYTFFRLNTYLQLFAMVLLIWQFAPTEKLTHALLGAYVLGTFVPVADTLRRRFSGTMTYYERYASAGFDPNDLALCLALSLPMSYYLWLRSREAWTGTRKAPLQWIFPIQMAAVCANILLTASRGGTLAAILALSVILWTVKALTRRLRFTVLAMGLVSAAAVPLLVPPSSWKRLATFGTEVREGTLNARTRIWKDGLQVYPDVPFQGVGTGAYPQALAQWWGQPNSLKDFTPVAHNTFLSILVETGLIGAVCFAAMLAALGIAVYHMGGLRRAYGLTTLAVWALGVSSLTWEDRKPMWLIFALLIAHSGASRAMRGSLALPARGEC